MGKILIREVYSFGLLVILCSLISCHRQEEVSVNEDDTVVEKYDLSSIRRIALMQFVGRSESSPSDTLHHTLMNEMWAKLEILMEEDTLIEFIPVEQIINNDIYKSSTSESLPSQAYSPVSGLSYFKPNADEGYDLGPLLKSLNADACLAIVIIWGNQARVKDGDYFITAYVESGLIVPPEETIWQLTGSSKYLEERIGTSNSFKGAVLHLSLGLRWVFLMPPSEKQYAKLTKYAIEKDTKIAENVALGLYNSLHSSLQN